MAAVIHLQLVRPQPRIIFGRAFIGSLVDRAAELTGIPQESIAGPDKHQDVCLVRFAIIRVARDAGKSLTQIGRVLGWRDHSTILSGFHRAIEIEQADSDFAELVNLLRQEPVR